MVSLSPPSTTAPDRVLKPRCVNRIDAARYLGVSANLFDKEVRSGLLPAPITIGRRRVWDLKLIDATIDQFSGSGCGNTEGNNPWDIVNEASV